MSSLELRSLAAFDPSSAELYASVSSDNRLRVWNTATGQLRQQYVEPKHLSKQYTCLAWYRQAPKGKRSSSGAGKRTSMGLIALGTDKGSISLWDLKRGTVVHSLGEGEGLPSVTSVAFSLDGKSLYSASSAKDVIEWNLETGKVARKLKGLKNGATKLCLHPLGKILAIASASIRLLDLSTGKRARKLSASHSGAVKQLAFSADGRYLASSASSSRFANVFDVAGKDAPSEPVVTVGFAGTPVFLAVHSSASAADTKTSGQGKGQGDQLTVVGGFDTGGVSVLRTRRQADGKSGTVSKLDIRGHSKTASPSALLACLAPERSSSALLVALGSHTSPDFTEVVFENDTGDLLTHSAIEFAGKQSANEDDSTALAAKTAPAHVVGPGELGIRGSEVDGIDGGDDHSVITAGGVGANGRPLKRLKSGGGDSDLVAGDEGESGVASNAAEEPTIAERLEALSEEIDEEYEKRDQKHARDASALVSKGRDGAQPRVESLTTVLTQALQSGDDALLEHCFAVGDPEVIEATVERLPSSKVLPFLTRVVAKLENRPGRSASLGRWIRAVLVYHLGYLVSIPDLPSKLALLHQLIDRRVASFPKLLQLQGRLDLLLARTRSGAAIASEHGRAGGPDRIVDQPEAVYREEDDEDEEDSEEDGDEDDGDGDEDGDEDAGGESPEGEVSGEDDDTEDDE